MAVVVVQTDADHREPGVHGSQKRRIEVRRSVVRHFQHIRAQLDARIEQRPLRLDFGVARQQDADPTDHRPDDERGVVRVRTR
ncbi:MAG TPA: hypothetical protein VFU35_06390, partial [Jatrophihabitans sp.]|nr:hypothetical protein [Jatrophihabitans sp.]